ncbi:MAG: HugZ family protein [Mastigocoleus sp.]
MSEFAEIKNAYQSFPDKFQSVVIGTISKDGIPNASYAPCLVDESKNIYIYVSGLSLHTQNLLINPQASLLFIEDESETKQIFARRRLNYECRANLLERDTQTWLNIINHFEERFGELIKLLQDLPDFRIFQFQPYGGRFVVGFGNVFKVDPDDLNNLIQITKDNK